MYTPSQTAWRVASTLATSTAVVATSIYVSRTARRITASSKLDITDENTAEASFLESHTIHNYVNPLNKASRVLDTHSVTFHVPLSKGVSNETILAQATKNFFNGWVFYPEALALSLFKPENSKYSSMFYFLSQHGAGSVWYLHISCRTRFYYSACTYLGCRQTFGQRTSRAAYGSIRRISPGRYPCCRRGGQSSRQLCAKPRRFLVWVRHDHLCRMPQAQRGATGSGRRRGDAKDKGAVAVLRLQSAERYCHEQPPAEVSQVIRLGTI